jgi:hypothetical protein
VDEGSRNEVGHVGKISREVAMIRRGCAWRWVDVLRSGGSGGSHPDWSEVVGVLIHSGENPVLVEIEEIYLVVVRVRGWTESEEMAKSRK